MLFARTTSKYFFAAAVMWISSVEAVFSSDFSVQIYSKQGNNPERVVLGFEAAVALSRAEGVFKKLNARSEDYNKVFLINKGKYIIVSFLSKELALDGGQTIDVILNSENLIVEGVSWKDRHIDPPKPISDELKVELQ